MKKIDTSFIFIATTSIVAVLYFSIGVNSWKFSYVGDEWIFYTFAKNLLKNPVNPFHLQGAYPETPVLGSYIQAFFLKLLGENNFAWRLSNIICIIPLSIFFYLFLNKLFNKKVAVLGTLTMQSSFYLANFFKIGKPIPLSLVLFVALLYLGLKCAEKKSNLFLLLYGAILGISFYIYIGPIFPVIFIPYLVFILIGKMNFKQLVASFLKVAIVYILFMSPLLIDINSSKSYFMQVSKKSIVKKEYTNNWQMVTNIGHNFLLFYKNYDYMYNHFVSGPYLDLISRIAACVGTIYCLINWEKRSYCILLASYFLTALTIGITSPYPYAPTTRGLFFLPFGFTLAALGIYVLYLRLSRTIRPLSIILILGAVFGLNYYQSQIGVFAEVPQNDTMRIMRFLQESKKNEKNNIVLIVSPSNNLNQFNIKEMRQAYNLQDFNFKISSTNELNCSDYNNSALIVLRTDKEAINTFTRVCSKKISEI